MNRESVGEMEKDLQNLDKSLFRMAEKSMSAYEPGDAMWKNVLYEAKKTESGDSENSPASFSPRKAKPGRKIFSGAPGWARLLAAAACVAVFAFIGFRSLLPENLGALEYRSGETSLLRSGSVVNTENSDDLVAGDVLNTENGVVSASIDNRVQLLVNRGTQLTVQERNRLEVKNGEIWVYVDPGSGKYSVSLPEGSVHVIGTSFGVSVNEEGSKVSVNRGKVLYRAGEKEIFIEKEQSLFLPAEAGSSGAVKTSDKNLRQPPNWVSSLVREMADEKLKKFFPSAVPIR